MWIYYIGGMGSFRFYFKSSYIGLKCKNVTHMPLFKDQFNSLTTNIVIQKFKNQNYPVWMGFYICFLVFF